MYVGGVNWYLSDGLFKTMYVGVEQLCVSVYCRRSRPMRSGDSPGTMSNVKDTGLELTSIVVSIHDAMTGLGSWPSCPHPCR